MACGEIGDVDKSRERNVEAYSMDDVEESEKGSGDVVVIESLFPAVGFEGDSEAAFLEAFFLLREASGSFMKMHSLPRDVHLEQGYCRLHLTFDSAQA
jgi:hypothetical protein